MITLFEKIERPYLGPANNRENTYVSQGVGGKTLELSVTNLKNGLQTFQKLIKKNLKKDSKKALIRYSMSFFCSNFSNT